MLDGLGSLLAVMVVVAAAPIVVAFLPGRVPQVVLLIAGGIVIGTEVLDLAQPDDITLFANLGLGFLFLLAGYELDPTLLRERSGKLAIVAWVITIVLAIATVGALELAGLVKAFVPVAIGLTTTALGTLLPILRDHHMLEGRFGRSLFAAGAIGEMGPVLCIALLLGHYNSIVEVIGVAAVAGVAFALSVIPRFTQGTRFGRVLEEGQHETSQTTLRLTVLLLVALLYLSARVRPGHRARRVLRRHGAASVGARGCRVARGEARRRGIRVLHPGLLRVVGDGPRCECRSSRRPGGCSGSSCYCSSCAACRRSSSTARTCRLRDACR